jgi:hypothetical protein
MAEKMNKLANFGTDLLKKVIPPGIYAQVDDLPRNFLLVLMNAV